MGILMADNGSAFIKKQLIKEQFPQTIESGFCVIICFCLFVKVNLDLENPLWSTACFSPTSTLRESSPEQQVWLLVCFLFCFNFFHFFLHSLFFSSNRKDRKDSSDWSLNGRDWGARSKAASHCGWHARIRRCHQQSGLVWDFDAIVTK